MQPPVSEVVRSNHELARLLLCNIRVTAVECAAATLPVYPYPIPSDAFWKTAAGVALAAWASEQGDMTPELMHASPEAASAVLFDQEWRKAAAHACQARLTTLDDVVAQFCNEVACTASFARLQLASAQVDVVPELSGVYVTRRHDCCHIMRPEVVLELPSEPTFGAMQDDLSLDEQLLYLIGTDDMACQYSRVANGQALALQESGVIAGGPVLPDCLSFCQQCGTNWCTDYTGTFTALLRCTEPTCTRVVHQSCHGPGPFTCAEHKHSSTSTRTPTCLPVCSPVLCCRGIVPFKGAWCLELCKWPGTNQSPALGYLHPLSLAAVADEAERRIACGLWTHRPLMPSISTVRGVLTQLGHHLAVPSGQMTAELMPWPDHLGQKVWKQDIAWCLSPGIASTLLHLRVYEDFHLMHQRFLAAGCPPDELDGVIQQWMIRRMPLLSGRIACHRYGTQSRALHAEMHTQVAAALLSPKVLDRCRQSSILPAHWIPAEVDASFPASADEDAAAMHSLGLSPAAAVPMPVKLKKEPALPAKHVCRPLPAFPLRVMLNPSQHVAVLHDVLRAAPAHCDVSGAMAEFVQHEVPPLASVDDRAVELFRQACVRSPYYGRVYSCMLASIAKWPAHEIDPTGLLPVDGAGTPQWNADWSVVDMLCTCTNATLVCLGNGDNSHMHTILDGRRAFLFEVDAGALQRMAEMKLPPTVHIVPTLATGFLLDTICAKTIVLTRHSWSLPDYKQCVLHKLKAGPPDSHGTHSRHFVDHFPGTQWKHYAATDQVAFAAQVYPFIRNTLTNV